MYADKEKGYSCDKLRKRLYEINTGVAQSDDRPFSMCFENITLEHWSISSGNICYLKFQQRASL